MEKREWLMNIRNEAGLKQYEVAEMAGISRGYYSAIENGMRKSPGEVALKIAIVLDFPMDKFYTDEIQDWLDSRKEVVKNA